MTSMSRVTKAALFVALIGVAGCDDSLAPRGETFSDPPAPSPIIAPPRVLSDAEAIGVFTRAAARGDSSAARELQSVADVRQGRVAAPQRIDGADPNDPTTWGDARIYDPHLFVSLNSGDAYAIASMRYDGHIGFIDLKYSLSELGGREVQDWGPVRKMEFNPLGVYHRAWLQHGVQLSLGSCGYRMDASAFFGTWFIVLPLPTNIGFMTLPQGTTGETYDNAYEHAQQQSCSPSNQNPGSGGGDGGGSGYWLTYTECNGYDYYVNGVYVFSAIEVCWSKSIFVGAAMT